MRRTAKTSEQTLRWLAQFESRNVTYQEASGEWPIVWERARGMHVWDAQGRRYLDLTSAFGVCALGHGHRKVVAAAKRQMDTLLHAMGDVHPHPGKAELARELSRLTFERWSDGKKSGKTIFCNSGFEAVEAGLKTARLATGKRGVVAFEGGYHGLGYGALNVTARKHFSGPFENQLGKFASFVPFPAGNRRSASVSVRGVIRAMDAVAARDDVGAVVLEPVQARGGFRVPPAGFLEALRGWCDRRGAKLVLDEVYTGFGRTGAWFACEHEGVIPDVICLGKALTGGFPLSACVGEAGGMDAAWPVSTGEAIHTSTFLGHPVGCAMALAQIREMRGGRWVGRADRVGRWWEKRLDCSVAEWNASAVARGRRMRYRRVGCGMMQGIEFQKTREGGNEVEVDWVMSCVKRLLARGILVLPEGDRGEVLGMTPPLIVGRDDLERAVRAVGEAIREEEATR